MIEYTYADIIMDPEDPRLEGAIGKECYFGEYPTWLLDYARNNSPGNLHILKRINNKPVCHFTDECEASWTLIIIKKEEPKPKPKYVPFQDGREFFNSYLSVESWLEKEDYFLSNHGIWLKDKDIDGVFYVVTEIWKDGVVLGSDQSTTKWDDLLCGYTFLDSSPCGKSVEE